jgi:diguanylate cyclase (GGDEF)-like protein
MQVKSAPNPNFSLVLVLAAAIGSSIFTIAAGTLVYRATARLISAGRWVEHTQEVLTSLQSATQSVDRVESNSRLYLTTKDDDQLNAVRAGILRLQVTALHIKAQVADNPHQDSNIAALEDCSSGLSKSLDTLSNTKVIPQVQLFRCRQAINQMSEEEKDLLRTRSEASQSEAARSLTTDIAFAGLSLLLLFVLFGFLLRDGLTRGRMATHAAAINRQLAATVNALEERAAESHLLTSVRDELQLCVELQQVYDCAARSVAQLLPGSAGAMGMIDNSRHTIETVAQWGYQTSASPLPEIFSPASCCGLRSGTLRWRRPDFSEIHCTHFRPETAPDSYLCLPMAAHGETLGTLFVQATAQASPELIQTRLDGLRQIIQLIGMSIASMHLRLKLEHQSIRDPLTGLFNRHFMQIALQKELARAKRRQNTLAVFMVDVDHFKSYNDQFGHAAGDSALASVASALQSSVRAEDFVCRYGGEEFVIVLPEITVEAALALADRIRQIVSRLDDHRDGGEGRAITVSVGVALFPADGLEAAEVIDKADQALYRAKNEGRDRVVLYDDPSAHQLPAALLPHLAVELSA